jgi:light-regulated signal transduction histidine kinase (bacteriophytochrome)
VVENGKTVAIVGSLTDITERKQAEEKIDQLHTDLAARAAELALANQDLEAFNYTVAHDLRQPLNLLSTCCQAVQMMCGDQLGEECAGYIQKGHKAILRMNSIIEALLNFARIGHAELNRELLDLCLLAHEVARELKQTDPERQVDFRIAEGIMVKADASLLRLALDNLIGNAWKYTNKREKAVIEIGVTDIDGALAYFVRDNGSGFNGSFADKIFAPFQCLPGAGERKGFGIGLATVEGIIRRHGGKIWAEGEPDKGATFYFTLPDDGGTP